MLARGVPGPAIESPRTLTTNLSKTQIDRLGDRLKRGSLVESDLRSLDDYRRTFGEAYETVVQSIREQLHLEPTGRPAKSTGSLIEKLHRESIRLTQVQDIAGCRVIVADVAEQERVVASLCTVFPTASVVDRRAIPSHGYRAVHVVAQVSGTLVEIQVRSSLQHLWGELSEKLSDVVDPSIKYGGGPAIVRALLSKTSDGIARFEETESQIAVLETDIIGLAQRKLPEEDERRLRVIEQQVAEKKEKHAKSKEQLRDALNEGIAQIAKLKKQGL